MRSIKDIDQDLRRAESTLQKIGQLIDRLHWERREAVARNSADKRLARLCDEVLERFRRNEWVSHGTGGRPWWCGDVAGALIEPVAPDHAEAIRYMEGQGLLELVERKG